MKDYRKQVCENVYDASSGGSESVTYANKTAAYAELSAWCPGCEVAFRKSDAREGDWCPICGEDKLVHYYA